MPQWLNLPSIQKSYGAHTVAIRPLTDFRIPDPLAHPLLRRFQLGEIFLVGKIAHIRFAVAHAHGVKTPLRLQDLARAFDVLRGHGVEEHLHGLEHRLLLGNGRLRRAGAETMSTIMTIRTARIDRA